MFFYTSVVSELAEYFVRQRTRFDVPLAFVGTEFQLAMWRALMPIPYGETRSRGGIARQIGISTASRAVRAANSCNPISIIAPCHRVIGSSGALTGFAGGLTAKRSLLDLEAPSGGTSSWRLS
jgi:methylated-DNA-[protein]-cysteine S-methyltransferase